MAKRLADFREQYPQYAEVDDERLADALYSTFYDGKIDRGAFRREIGLDEIPAGPPVPTVGERIDATQRDRERQDPLAAEPVADTPGAIVRNPDDPEEARGILARARRLAERGSSMLSTALGGRIVIGSDWGDDDPADGKFRVRWMSEPELAELQRQRYVPGVRDLLLGRENPEEGMERYGLGILPSVGETVFGRAGPVDVAKRIGPNIAESTGAMTTEMIAGLQLASLDEEAEGLRNRLRRPRRGEVPLPPEVRPRVVARLKEVEELRRLKMTMAYEAAKGAERAVPPDAGLIERGVQQGVPSAMIAVPAAMATGGVGAAAVFGTGAAGQRYAELRNQGLEESAAGRSALLLGTLEGLTEFLPARTLLKRSEGFDALKGKIAEFFASELPGESTNTVAQMVDDYANGLRDDVTAGDLASALSDTTIQTVLGGVELMHHLADKANEIAARRSGEPSALAEGDRVAPTMGDEIPPMGPGAPIEPLVGEDIEPFTAPPRGGRIEPTIAGPQESPDVPRGTLAPEPAPPAVPEAPVEVPAPGIPEPEIPGVIQAPDTEAAAPIAPPVETPVTTPVAAGPEIEPTAEPKGPASYDPRLQRDVYRGALAALGDELTPGGGVSYVTDEHGTITGRTPSVNPSWFQTMQGTPELKMSVASVQAAVEKALNNQRLGVREARVVGAMLDTITGQRTSPENMTYIREQLARARMLRQEARRAAGVEMGPETAPIETYVGEQFEEHDYAPEMDGEARALWELVVEAEQAGFADAVDRIMAGAATNQEAANDLQGLIREHAATSTGPATATAGAIERPVAEGAQPRDRRATARDGRDRRDAARRERFNALPKDEQLRLIYADELIPELGNRRAFDEALRDGAPFVASIDADSLKAVNDTLGHDAGDALLKAIGAALKGTGLEGFRAGGDEFYAVADSREALAAGIEQMQRELGEQVLETDKGSVRGLGVTIGTGTNKAEADTSMEGEKIAREQRGERSPRGAAPPGLTLQATRPVNMAAGTNYVGNIGLLGELPINADRQYVLGHGRPVRIPEKPIRRRQIIRHIERELGVKFNFGRVKGRGVLGFMRPGIGEIRVKATNDIETLAHELAHWLDDTKPWVRDLYMSKPDEVAETAWTESDDETLEQRGGGGSADLFGDDTRTAQEIADAKRKLDERLRGTRDVAADTGAPGDLFTRARQADIEDVTPKGGALKAVRNVRGSTSAKGTAGSSFREELRGVSYDAKKIYEGYAEFMRLWFTQDYKAMGAAPSFYDAWMAELAKHPKLAEVLLDVQEMMHAWHLQGARARLASKIGKEKLSLVQQFEEAKRGADDKLLQRVFDGIRQFKVAERDIRGELADATQSGYLSLRLAAAANDISEAVYERGTLNWNEQGDLEFTGEGMRSVFAAVEGKRDEMAQYAVARRAQELAGQGRENLIRPDEIVAGLAIGEQDPDIKDAFERWLAFNTRMLDFYQASGLLSDATRKAIDEMNKNYVPFNRVVDAFNGQKVKAGGGSPFVRLRGGTANINDIFDSMVGNTAHLITMSLVNHGKALFYRMIDEQAGRLGKGATTGDVAARYAVPIGKDTKPVQIDRQQVLKAVLEGLGLNMRWYRLASTGLVNSPEEELAVAMIGRMMDGMEPMLTFFQPNQDPKGNVDFYFEQGRKKFYEINDPLLYESIQQLGPRPYNLAVSILGGFASVYRRGVTATPTFQAKNFIRDTFHAFTGSKGQMIPVVGATKALLERLWNDEHYWLARINGMGFSSMAEAAGIARDRIIDTPGGVLRAYDRTISAAEYANRLAEFKALVDKGYTKRQAAYLGREISTDFAMRGSSKTLRVLTTAVWPLNARLQGLYWQGRQLGQMRHGRAKFLGAQALSFALRAVIVATLPSLWLYFRNKDDERYQEMPEWLKDQSWVVFTGTGEDDYVLIPKPFETGQLFGTLPERTIEYMYSHDERELADAIGWMVTETFALDVVPQAYQPWREIELNRNFTGAPIIPEYLEDVEPAEQYRAYTSDSMIALGREMGLSPMKAEHVVRGHLGTLGAWALGLSDYLVGDLSQGGVRPASRWQDNVLLAPFVDGGPLRRTKSEDDFYELLQQTRQAATTLSLIERRSPERVEAWVSNEEKQVYAALNEQLNGIAAGLRDLNNAIDTIRALPDISADDKRTQIEELQRQKNALTRAVRENLNRNVVDEMVRDAAAAGD